MEHAGEGQVERLALLLGLQRRARQAESVAELGFVAVNETRQLLEYRQAALWLGSGKRVAAVSGLPQPETHAPYTQWLCRLFSRLPDQPCAFTLSAHDAPPRVAADWEQWLPAHALLAPLNRSNGERLSVLLLARDEPWHDAEIALLDELAGAYGHALALLAGKPSWLKSAGRAGGVPRLARNLALLAALGIGLWWPVALTTLAPAEVVASDPFLVRAPIEGVIDRFHVRPNQPVKAGDLLFEFDATSLKSKRDIARSSLSVAAEEYRQAAQLAVTNEKGKLEMAVNRGREAERAAEVRFSENMLKRIQVAAPREGVAIFAEASDWVGRAVSLGERVIEIADPDQVELLIRLPVADALTLEPGAPVRLFLATTPQDPLAATVRYAAYRAEAMPDGTVAYRVKATFAAGQKLPRVGLMGTAKLYGEKMPFAYYLLRRPLAVARQWLGW